MPELLCALIAIAKFGYLSGLILSQVAIFWDGREGAVIGGELVNRVYDTFAPARWMLLPILFFIVAASFPFIIVTAFVGTFCDYVLLYAVAKAVSHGQFDHVDYGWSSLNYAAIPVLLVGLWIYSLAFNWLETFL